MNTQTQEALKMLDAMRLSYSDLIYNEAGFEKAEEFEDDIIAVKEAIATNEESSVVQPAQEPYAWATEWEDGEWSISHSPHMGKQSIPLYPHSTPDSTLDSTLDSTHPHQWQELTNEDIARLILINEVDGTGDVGLARLVEHASRIKNHG
jgi:hypothetical protein